MGGFELFMLCVGGAVFGAGYAIYLLWITVSLPVFVGVMLAYVVGAALTSGAARHWAPPKAGDEGLRPVFFGLSTVGWPLFWIILGVILALRALYRLGARG